MYARVTEWDGVTTAEIDRDLAYTRGQAVTRLEEDPGVVGMLALVDRDDGRSMNITLYNDRAALEASRDVARDFRQLIEQRRDLRRPPTVREFEVGVATLRSWSLGLPSPG